MDKTPPKAARLQSGRILEPAGKGWIVPLRELYPDAGIGIRGGAVSSLVLEGFEVDLRLAGFIRDDERCPRGFPGAHATEHVRISCLRDGRVRVWVDREEAAARDVAFRRFLERAIGDANG